MSGHPRRHDSGCATEGVVLGCRRCDAVYSNCAVCADIAAMAAAVDSEATSDDVSMTSSLADVSGLDALVGSSTRMLASVAGAADDVDTQIVQQQVSSVNGSGAGGPAASMTSVAGLLSRRNRTSATPTDNGPSIVSLHDVRKFVFQAPSRTDKRVMGGLRAHTFTSQTFISSFAVGLAIGSILAIIIKLLTEVGYRVLPYHR